MGKVARPNESARVAVSKPLLEDGSVPQTRGEEAANRGGEGLVVAGVQMGGGRQS